MRNEHTLDKPNKTLYNSPILEYFIFTNRRSHERLTVKNTYAN